MGTGVMIGAGIFALSRQVVEQARTHTIALGFALFKEKTMKCVRIDPLLCLVLAAELVPPKLALGPIRPGSTLLRLT
ncbi:hypothetical protein K2D_19660 [Planctomycetes bacterium K2D]|nr:hypothetical protein K2D_19660 [Planctomycetes bacterium K2D]